MKLVIVESASKTKTIQKYLGGDYKVVASLGHVMNFPAKALGIDTDTWELSYEPIPQKLKTLKQLRGYVKEASEVYLASDPDREGEAIAWHLEKALNLKKPKRILFHEITKKAVLDAVAAPTTIDLALVAAQQSRQTLDRLVGWKISPLLWKRFTEKNLSAGRVQSVALKAISERFKDYEAHEAEKFWNIEGHFNIGEKLLETDLCSSADEKKVRYTDLDAASKLLTYIQKHKLKWKIQVEQKHSLRNPSPPYTTSSLQQDVYETYKISAKDTMKIAQTLYEGGYITYMRTDSTNLSNEAKQNIKSYLDTHYPEHHQERSFKSKVANAQEAHEAIRPTQIASEASSLEKLTPIQKKIYDLIWRRAVASQMIPAEYCDFIIRITATSAYFKDYVFIGKLSYVNKLGYLAVWKPAQKVECADWVATEPVPLKFMAKGDITKPEGLYTEASLIKWMEKEGIGRPSTYASIVEKLLERNYVFKGANPLRSETLAHLTLENNKLTPSETVINRGGTETDRFVPTSLGLQVAEYIQSIFPKMMDYAFTSKLEDELDDISRKQLEKNMLLNKFYQELLPVLKEAEEQRKTRPATAKKTQAKAAPEPLKTFANGSIQLIQTRYGPALFTPATKTYVSVTPFLLWRKIELMDISEKDVTFLHSLPISIDSQMSILYGRYGLYLKQNDKNIPIAKEHWDSVYDGTWEKDKLTQTPPFVSRKKKR